MPDLSALFLVSHSTVFTPVYYKQKHHAVFADCFKSGLIRKVCGDDCDSLALNWLHDR